MTASVTQHSVKHPSPNYVSVAPNVRCGTTPGTHVSGTSTAKPPTSASAAKTLKCDQISKEAAVKAAKDQRTPMAKSILWLLGATLCAGACAVLVSFCFPLAFLAGAAMFACIIFAAGTALHSLIKNRSDTKERGMIAENLAKAFNQMPAEEQNDLINTLLASPEEQKDTVKLLRANPEGQDREMRKMLAGKNPEKNISSDYLPDGTARELLQKRQTGTPPEEILRQAIENMATPALRDLMDLAMDMVEKNAFDALSQENQMNILAEREGFKWDNPLSIANKFFPNPTPKDMLKAIGQMQEIKKESLAASKPGHQGPDATQQGSRPQEAYAKKRISAQPSSSARSAHPQTGHRPATDTAMIKEPRFSPAEVKKEASQSGPVVKAVVKTILLGAVPVIAAIFLAIFLGPIAAIAALPISISIFFLVLAMSSYYASKETNRREEASEILTGAVNAMPGKEFWKLVDKILGKEITSEELKAKKLDLSSRNTYYLPKGGAKNLSNKLAGLVQNGGIITRKEIFLKSLDDIPTDKLQELAKEAMTIAFDRTLEGLSIPERYKFVEEQRETQMENMGENDTSGNLPPDPKEQWKLIAKMQSMASIQA
ncbi:MAG: hypothetical protein LBT98_02210 [Puniceicoccales bacterium]|jgi:hypothetical protein|nr:hypothetical protein [Puniceicoccales bacterium]